MSVQEYILWAARWEARSFGQHRAEIANAIGYATITNCWASKPIKPTDLLPVIRREVDQRQGLEMFRVWAGNLNQRNNV